MRSKLSSLSLIFSALAVPLALFVSKVLEFILKSTNPSNVNVASTLAYLGIIIMSGIVVAVLCWAAALGFVLVAKKRAEEPWVVRAAFIVLFVTIALTIVGLLASKTTDNIIDNAPQIPVSSQE